MQERLSARPRLSPEEREALIEQQRQERQGGGGGRINGVNGQQQR